MAPSPFPEPTSPCAMAASPAGLLHHGRACALVTASLARAPATPRILPVRSPVPAVLRVSTRRALAFSFCALTTTRWAGRFN